MPDYQRGKIYKITSGDLTYIGSTCEPTLARRLAEHVHYYKRWKDVKRNNVTSFQVLELGNYEITLLELCPCGSKDELIARERFWIKTTPCVNKIIPGQTRKEYMEIHKEQIKERQKKYHEKHKEERNEYQKKYTEDHKERVKERIKKYTEDHKEKINEKKKEWYQLNKEKLKEKRLQKSNLIIS